METATQDMVERLFHGTIAMLEMYSVVLGDRLGLYAQLRSGGPATANELADRAGIHPRYAREWLEQQATAGFLEVDDVTAPTGTRRFSLPEAHSAALTDRDSLDHIAPLTRLAAAVGRPMDALAEAFRTGGGVPWEAYGQDGREGQAFANRPTFLNVLPTVWLPALPDIHARLTSGPARIADIGCGGGYACIGMAQHFPHATVDGFDLDAASVDLARRNVADAGLEERITIHHRDASDPSDHDGYDLVTVLEVLHDVARPVELLANARQMTNEGGAVLVVDERVADEFGAIGDDIERIMYGFSVLCCLPAGMSEDGSAGTGTVMRRAVLEAYAADAGFARVEVLDVENDFFRLYRLHA